MREHTTPPSQEQKIRKINKLLKKDQFTTMGYTGRGKDFPDTSANLTAILQEAEKNNVATAHLASQKKNAEKMKREGKVKVANHYLDHTLADSQKISGNLMSARFQFLFSPACHGQAIDYPFIEPLSSSKEDEQQAICASVYGWHLVPEKLIDCFFRRYTKQGNEPLPPEKLLAPKKGRLKEKRARLMTYDNTIDAFKNYLLTGMKHTYLNSVPSSDETPDGLQEKTTPRKMTLEDGTILLIQHHDNAYPEKHLKKYVGTDYYIKVFSSPEAWKAYEQETIKRLSPEIIEAKYAPVLAWFTSEVRSKDDDSALLKNEIIHTPKRFISNLQEILEKVSTYGTAFDRKIVALCEQMLASTHTRNLQGRKNQILKLINKAKETAKDQQAMIQKQIDEP